MRARIQLQVGQQNTSRFYRLPLSFLKYFFVADGRVQSLIALKSTREENRTCDNYFAVVTCANIVLVDSYSDSCTLEK